MDWAWAFISTVVADVGEASAFYAGALGLPELALVELGSIEASGQLFDLGANVGLAVVSPTGTGRAQQLLEAHRGGLCHLGLAAEQLPEEGRPTSSSFGEGRLVSLADGLELEFVHSGFTATSSSPGESDGPAVAGLDHVATVVPSLDAATEQLDRLGIREDPQTSRWDFPQLQTRNAVFPGRSGYLELNQAFGAQGVFGSLAAARGSGIVGLTLTVVDMDAALERLRGVGIGVSDPGPVLARSPDGADRDLGRTAVVSMKHSFGTRLFLFAPSASAPHYGEESTEAR